MNWKRLHEAQPEDGQKCFIRLAKGKVKQRISVCRITKNRLTIHYNFEVQDYNETRVITEDAVDYWAPVLTK